MMVAGAFGSFLDRRALDQLSKYKYVSVGSTPIDRLMNPFWNFVVSYIPVWVSPNLLTLLGFASTLVCLVLTCVFMPTLKEAAPPWVYLANLVLLFIYQTLDAVDGKQARRTNTATPLGQLFDHGCDSFSTVFAALSVLGTVRFGISVASFMLIAILQMQLFMYTAFLAYPFYLLLIEMLTADVINGCKKAERSKKAMCQLLGCLFHVLMQIPLFWSSTMEEHPVLCYLAMIFNTSIIALRLNLSATCRMEFYPIQWPVIPFWLCCIWLYVTSPGAAGAAALLPELLQQQLLQQQQYVPYGSAMLLGVLLWSGLYLVDFLLSTVSLICCHFNIKCFGVGEKAQVKDD